MVATPQQAAGQRSEPPISLPWAMQAIPAAIEAAAPPEEPPQVMAESHGFSVWPCSGLSVKALSENSGVLVCPMITAPALRKLAATGLSEGAIRAASPGTPLELAWPSRSTLIFTVTGTPCRGPSDRPAAWA